jgi:hypothetical protein
MIDKCVQSLLYLISILNFILRDLETKDGLNVARDEFVIFPFELSSGSLTILRPTSDCLVTRMLRYELATIHTYRTRIRRLT